jgi:hypothetical protein
LNHPKEIFLKKSLKKFADQKKLVLLHPALKQAAFFRINRKEKNKIFF